MNLLFLGNHSGIGKFLPVHCVLLNSIIKTRSSLSEAFDSRARGVKHRLHSLSAELTRHAQVVKSPEVSQPPSSLGLCRVKARWATSSSSSSTSREMDIAGVVFISPGLAAEHGSARLGSARSGALLPH